MTSMKCVSATARLKQDYIRLKRDPVPYVVAEPFPSNILEWHYVVKGPEKTPYEGGIYYGKLIFPREFPFKPPSILMITPNGRFKTNTKLCLSISDFHPDTWNPAWSVSTILTGLLSFMIEKSPTFGSIASTDSEKRIFAKQSLEFNLRIKTFCDLFPELVESMRLELSLRSQNENTTSINNNCSETNTINGLSPRGVQRQMNLDQGSIQSAIANIFVIVGFAAFAYTVKYILFTIDRS